MGGKESLLYHTKVVKPAKIVLADGGCDYILSGPPVLITRDTSDNARGGIVMVKGDQGHVIDMWAAEHVGILTTAPLGRPHRERKKGARDASAITTAHFTSTSLYISRPSVSHVTVAVLHIMTKPAAELRYAGLNNCQTLANASCRDMITLAEIVGEARNTSGFWAGFLSPLEFIKTYLPSPHISTELPSWCATMKFPSCRGSESGKRFKTFVSRPCIKFCSHTQSTDVAKGTIYLGKRPAARRRSGANAGLRNINVLLWKQR